MFKSKFDHEYSLNIFNINKKLIETHFKEVSIINLNHKMIRLINITEYKKENNHAKMKNLNQMLEMRKIL